MTRTGIRHPKTTFLVSESSSRFAKVWPAWLASVVVGKIEDRMGRKESDKATKLLTKRRPIPVETAITIRVSEWTDPFANVNLGQARRGLP